MELFILGVMVGLAVGYIVWRARATTPPAPTPQPAIEQQPLPDEAPVSAPAGSLGEQLHVLDRAIADFASSSAHPRELEEHRDFRDAVALLAAPAVKLETVLQYAQGANWTLACVGIAALIQREDRDQAAEAIAGHIGKLSPWAIHFALNYLLGVMPRPPVGAAVVFARDYWLDNPILPNLFRDYFARREAMSDRADFGGALFARGAAAPTLIKSFLERVNHPVATALLTILDKVIRGNVNHALLTSFGRFWDDAEPLIEVPAWHDDLAAALAALRQHPPRALLVTGEERIGKTAFLRLIARDLSDDGWMVFEAGAADLMAGQQWFGQLEGRIRQAVDELSPAKKLVWYIPDLVQFARSGTHQGQSASILDQILPAVTAGRLILWSETTPAGAARLMQLRPTLRALLEVITLAPLDEPQTLAVADGVAEELARGLKVALREGLGAAALAAVRQHLGTGNLPGTAVDLVKLTLARAASQGTVEPEAVIESLSQLTGLPRAVLDANARIDLAAVRAFFVGRVIGQDEAVSAIVDRIAMLKAGLNDPAKPIGVFLFAGPTGTGKTELAKATAEYLFGSVDRLIRIDMSELQTPESAYKITGSSTAAGDSESLIHHVRKQPFSVVLLDEFEKAHARIWDLFLQVFDEGRLTDTLGRTADFRHCLIILTTNLGATAHASAMVGFAPGETAFVDEQIHQAIRQTYRPEFQNRLDKVIVFRPLARAQMREILKKELAQLLARRGLKDRAWAVEWEASAQDFLLEKGFSPEMGARPLKRAIEHYVVAPLAATIVERRFPEGEQFVFVRSDGKAIQAEFVDPDAPTAAEASELTEAASTSAAPTLAAPTLAAMALTPAGTPAELEALRAEQAGVAAKLASPRWEALKDELLARMRAPEFWAQPARFATLAQLALMDRVAAAAETARSLEERLTRGRRSDKVSRELVARLALQLWLVKEGIADAFEAAPIEVALVVEPVLEPGPAGDSGAVRGAPDAAATRAWCAQLRAMYRGWAESRHMQLAELALGGDAPALLVAGFGAHRVLTREVGLHVLERGEDAARVASRVRLAVAPLGDPPPAKLQAAIAAALARAERPAIVRRYRGAPAPLVRNADGRWRTGKLDLVLRGNFDLIAEM